MTKYKIRFNLNEDILNKYSKLTYAIGSLKRLENLNEFPFIKNEVMIEKILYNILLLDSPLQVNKVLIRTILNNRYNINDDSKDFVLLLKKTINSLNKANPTSTFELTNMYKMLNKDNLDIQDNPFNTSLEDNDIVSVIKSPINKETLLKTTLFEIKHSKLPSILNALLFHFEFLIIKPFIKDNIVIANLWQSLFLGLDYPILNYISLEKIFYENKEELKTVISESKKENFANKYLIYLIDKIIIELNLLEDKTKKYFTKSNDKVSLLVNVMGDGPESAKELLDKLGLKSLNSFRKNYLYPALNLNLIKMTIPDKPNSRNQKYYKV